MVFLTRKCYVEWTRESGLHLKPSWWIIILQWCTECTVWWKGHTGREKKKSVSRKWFIFKRPYGEKSSPLFLPHFVLKRLPCGWGGFQQWLECVSLFTCCISFFQELRERERPAWWGSDVWDQRTAGCGASCVGYGAASLASTHWVPAASSPQVVTTQNIFVVKGPYESGLSLRTMVALTQSEFIHLFPKSAGWEIFRFC